MGRTLQRTELNRKIPEGCLDSFGHWPGVGGGLGMQHQNVQDQTKLVKPCPEGMSRLVYDVYVSGRWPTSLQPVPTGIPAGPRAFLLRRRYQP